MWHVTSFILNEVRSGGRDDGAWVRNIPEVPKVGGKDEEVDRSSINSVAKVWLSSFVKRDIGRLAQLTNFPFHANGKKVADNVTELSTFLGQLFETTGRTIYEWKIMSPAEYRKKFGSLPKGVNRAEKLLVFSVGAKNMTWIFSKNQDGHLGVSSVFL